jgi:hypothetical protein
MHLLLPTCTSLDNLKNKKKIQLIFENIFEYILNMWLINIIAIKLKIILMLTIK